MCPDCETDNDVTVNINEIKIQYVKYQIKE